MLRPMFFLLSLLLPLLERGVEPPTIGEVYRPGEEAVWVFESQGTRIG